jgi:pimeloyl-ACP methyl ester carboxylesterase
MALRTTRFVSLAVLACAVPACAASAPPLPPTPDGQDRETSVTRLSLTACEVPDVKRPARCALAHVPENRALPSGRVVPLKVVVVPASRSPAAPDPVVYLAGGPGEAATDEVADVLEQFSAVSEARDLVFIDQRGTSRDSPLRCAILDGSPDLGSLPGAPLPEARLRACLASMGADPAHYTTFDAVEDLDQVLGELGYTQVDVLGVSYGSYPAQVLAQAHGARVRSLVLSGVANGGNDMAFPGGAQRMLDDTFAACDADAECHARHASPRLELDAALARLQAHPATVTGKGYDGKTYSATLDVPALLISMWLSLYSPPGRQRVLSMIHDVADGRFDALGEPIVSIPFELSGLSIGAFLSITCPGLAKVSLADAERATANTFLGTTFIGQELRACSFWPTGAVPAWASEPLRGDLPALLLGGTLDPATPPENRARLSATLPHAQTVLVPGAGHDVGSPCIAGIVAAFLDRPLVKVDTACVKPVASHG